jgi:hypothetical protein
MNWSASHGALRGRGSLTVWFDPSTSWHASPSGERGGQPVHGDPAIRACLAVKVLFGLPPRQTSGLGASPPRLPGLDWPASDCPTPCRRRKTRAVL